MLPARAGGGQGLGLVGAVTGRHRPDQEAGRVDERRATGGPRPVDDPRPIRLTGGAHRTRSGLDRVPHRYLEFVSVGVAHAPQVQGRDGFADAAPDVNGLLGAHVADEHPPGLRRDHQLGPVWLPWSRVPPLALAGCGLLPRSCRSGCCSCSCATRRGTGRSRASRAPPLCAGATSRCWPPVRSTARSRQGAARRPATGQMQGYSGSHPNAPRDRCPRRASRQYTMAGSVGSVEVQDDERTRGPGVCTCTVRHDLDSGLTLLSRVGQIAELTAHHLGASDDAADDGFVDDRPEPRPVIAGQDLLPSHGFALLLSLSMAQFMVVLDFTIVNVALPSIQRDLASALLTATRQCGWAQGIAIVSARLVANVRQCRSADRGHVPGPSASPWPTCWPPGWCRPGRRTPTCRSRIICTVITPAGSLTTASPPRGPCRRPAGWGHARPALRCPSDNLFFCPNGSWFPGPYMYKPPLTG